MFFHQCFLRRNGINPVNIAKKKIVATFKNVVATFKGVGE